MAASSLARVSTAESVELPRRFGRYTLFDTIGRGGMAEIFLARASTDLGGVRLCVVKQILPHFADHPQFAEMLTFEAKLAAGLNHANIVQVFDLGRADGQLFIAMEYVEGFDLNALLRRCTERKSPLPFEFAIHVIAEMLRGLDYAHRRTDEDGRPLGIVHRDVSPSNVLLSFEGEVKLCDFGIAHANEHVRGVPADAVEALKGKAGYMSPEHARGEAIDARADVFATGIILWELLAGRRLYRSKSPVPLLDQARQADIPPLESRGLPAEALLFDIARRALARDREARYPSSAAMLRDIEEYMAEARLPASALRLGDWMLDQFGREIVTERRALERRASEPPFPVTSLVVPKGELPARSSELPPPVSHEPDPTGVASYAMPSEALRPARVPEEARITTRSTSSGDPLPSRAFWIFLAIVLVLALLLFAGNR